MISNFHHAPMQVASANAMTEPASADTITQRMAGEPPRPAPDIAPRIVRFRDAPRYLGMDRNRFNSEVRPYLTEVPIGKQGVGFDRLELDRWIDDYIARNGRPARKGEFTWDAREYPASSGGAVSGTSTNASAGGEFARALEQLKSRKRSGSSQD